jgi:hypothetical protein
VHGDSLVPTDRGHARQRLSSVRGPEAVYCLESMKAHQTDAQASTARHAGPGEQYVSDVAFERPGRLRRFVRAVLVNPAANYLPAGLTKAILRLTKSELAAANWADPGGWRSMVISYEGRPRQIADRVLVGGGAMPMALRNRRRLGAKVLADLIDAAMREPVHVLCLGAGPGHIVTDAMLRSRRRSRATLVDLSVEAFEYGRKVAKEKGLDGRVRYVQADARNLDGILDAPPDIVKMIGLCEYLPDATLAAVARAIAAAAPAGASIILNSLSKAHGTDRFFRRVFGLHMIHRSPAQLTEILAAEGFGDFVSLPEPLGVYHVITGRRKH